MHRPTVPRRRRPPLSTDDREPWEIPASGDPWDPSARPSPGWSPLHAEHTRRIVVAGAAVFLTSQSLVFLALASSGGVRFGVAAMVPGALSAALLRGTRHRLLEPERRFTPVMALLGVAAAVLALMLSWF